MADKFDEWLPDEQTQWALGSYQVADREDGEKKSNDDASQHLHGPVAPPPARELIIPARGKQLLAVWLGNKLKQKKKNSQIFPTCYIITCTLYHGEGISAGIEMFCLPACLTVIICMTI